MKLAGQGRPAVACAGPNPPGRAGCCCIQKMFMRKKRSTRAKKIALPMAATGEDRISQKIANAVRIRRAADTPPELDPNLPLTKGRGQRPAPLIFNPAAAQGGLPAEPPLTAAQMAVPPMPEEPPLSWQAPMEETFVPHAPDDSAQEEGTRSDFHEVPRMLTPDHVPTEKPCLMLRCRCRIRRKQPKLPGRG